MKEESRKIEFDIEALVLSAICVFVWLSLLSYDPADSLGELPGVAGKFLAIEPNAYPPNAQLANWCGWCGALLAGLLIQGLGIGSLLGALGLSVLAVWMFQVHSNAVRASRQIGWTLVLVAVTTFFALLKIDTPYSPVIGPGGYMGAMTSTWLNEHFAKLGALIMTLTVFMAGLLLSTDYVVIKAASRLLLGGAALTATAAAATKSRVSMSLPRGPSKRRSDVDEAIQLDDEPPAELLPPIRIGGKGLAATDAAMPPVAGQSRNSFLGTAKSLASSLWSAPVSDQPEPASQSFPDTSLEDHHHDEVDEEEQDGEEQEQGELFPDSRQAELDGQTVHVRADAAHEEPPEPNAPRIKPPKSKPKSKAAERQELSDSLAHLDDTKLPLGAEEYVLPGLDLLLEGDDIDFEAQTIEVRRKAKVLESTFRDFGLNVRVVEIETGPVIAQYEIELEAGLRLSKVTSLADDLAIALRVPGVRIVAPIPGKNTVGIEVPNETRQVVRLREVIEEQGARGKKAKIPLFLGKDVSGNALTADLATLPHLLIAGRTGTGKSVCLNAIIASILMTRRPDEVRMLMIDPKMVELSGYGRLPHLMHPVVTDMKKAEAILAWAVDKMEERYGLLARAGVRHITSYNELGREELRDRLKPESSEEAEAIPDHLPFIVIVADEMADLMMTAGKEVEQHIIRLAQKSRAVGIHLILATQKPTVDVITGLIKSNLPARIAFQVASQTDSRVVLDEMGANKLLGNGDMLFLWPGTSMLLRGQGTYLSDEELNAIVDHCSTGEQNFVNELVNLKIKEEGSDEPSLLALKKRDDLYEAAVDVVVREGRGSCSLLQRALGIGYGRAARLIDYMAEDGIVGEYAGSQAREVQISIAEWESMRGEDTADESPQRSNKIRPQDNQPAGNSAKSQPRRDETSSDEPSSEEALKPSRSLKISPHRREHYPEDVAPQDERGNASCVSHEQDDDEVYESYDDDAEYEDYD